MGDGDQCGKVGGRLRLRIIQNSKLPTPEFGVAVGRGLRAIYFGFMQWAGRLARISTAEDDAKKARGSFVMLVL